MTTIVLVLLATLAAAVGLPILFFALALAYVALDSVRDLLKTSALDCVQIYAAANSARLDIEQRQVRIDLEADYGRAAIIDNRQRLLTGGDK